MLRDTGLAFSRLGLGGYGVINTFDTDFGGKTPPVPVLFAVLADVVLTDGVVTRLILSEWPPT